jgi:hypothetical protein
MTQAHVYGAWLRQQRTSTSARAGSHSIDLIDITQDSLDANLRADFPTSALGRTGCIFRAIVNAESGPS